GAVRAAPDLGVPAARGCAADRRRARANRQPARSARPAARVGAHGRARRDDGRERLLPDDAVLLLLRVPGLRAGGAARLPLVADGVKVLVLTTSYPRSAEDVAGVFVADAVAAVRKAGVEVDVVSPAGFRDFGLAYGGGIVQNLRARPWLAAAVPLFL